MILTRLHNKRHKPFEQTFTINPPVREFFSAIGSVFFGNLNPSISFSPTPDFHRHPDNLAKKANLKSYFGLRAA